MGGGAGAAAVAAAAEPEVPQAALADLARVVPWACQVRGCSDKAKNGATNKYIARHRKYHKEEANKQRKLEAKRAADIAQKERAVGPSGKRKQNRLKDMRDKQRAAAKAANKGSGNGNTKGSGNGNTKGSGNGNTKGSGNGNNKGSGNGNGNGNSSAGGGKGKSKRQ